MINTIPNIKVDAFLKNTDQWKAEFEALRSILLEYEFNEDIKWGWPCYHINDKNVVLMHGFKDYCALLFMKGSILKDDHNLLIQQTKNVQAGRQLRFKDLAQIVAQKAQIQAIIESAIEVERLGLEVELKKTTEFEMVEELSSRFYENPDFKKAFEALTPGRQRAYLLHFSSPKQSSTRSARIDKCMDLIFDGKGLND